jgi:hypothetical protein
MAPWPWPACASRPELLAFCRALSTLDGILADITPDFRLDEALLA